MEQAGEVSIVASMLSADMSCLGTDLLAAERAGADRVQWDVMDGAFVPNLTFGPQVIQSCRASSSLEFEAHLMVENPERLIKGCIEAGCGTVIVHEEACTHLHRTLGEIRDLGANAGVALNPATPLEHLHHVMDLVDLILVMTVNPGFGGQDYLWSMGTKISQAAELARRADRNVAVEVDGGINAMTAPSAVAAGARLLVAGSSLFAHRGGIEVALKELRSAAEPAVGTKKGSPRGA
ncbi:MAG: ribulose-phosphate 3-epimerase [Actinobacteria bacterium]|nr:ribulose-phosphate 3-epimerase [Actinomycetota bacterium]